MHENRCFGPVLGGRKLFKAGQKLSLNCPNNCSQTCSQNCPKLGVCYKGRGRLRRYLHHRAGSTASPLESFLASLGDGRAAFIRDCSYSMLRNSASGPEIGFPGRILAGLLPGKHRNWSKAGRRADFGVFPVPTWKPDFRPGSTISQHRV